MVVGITGVSKAFLEPGFQTSALFVNKQLEHVKQLQCVSKIGAYFMKNEVYFC